MRRVRTRRALVLVPVLGLLLLVLGIAGYGTAGGAPKGPKIKNGGTITLALAEDPDKLDPTLARTFVGRIVFANMCEKLYDLNEKLEVVPQLAKALPTVSKDGLTVTIPLRSGIKFNDGTAFDAQAMKISLDRHRTLPGSSRASELSPVTSVDAVNPTTVVLHLSAPFAPLTALLADRAGMPMSPAQLDKLGDKFSTNPVCVGPFQFVSRTPGTEIVLKKSDQYYNAKNVHLDGIKFRIITDTSARLSNLRSHDVDVAERIAATDVAFVTTNPSLRLLQTPSIGYQGITINIGNVNGLGKLPYGTTDTPLGSHPELRKAFELALDRNVINKVAFIGRVVPDCQPLSPTSPWYAKSIACSKRDVAAAKKLIAKSKLPTPITVNLMIGTDEVGARVGQVIQALAKEAGFNVVLQPTEFVTALKRADDGKYDAFAIGWSGRVDPDGNIYQFHHTKGSLNDSGASDPRIDALLDKARTVSDFAARKKIYGEALKLMLDQRGIIYLYHAQNFVGESKKVAGVQMFGDGLVRFTNAGFTG